MAEVSGGRVRATRQAEVRRYEWCEGGFGQQRNDGGGCVTMPEKSERVESHGAYVTD